MSDPFSHSHTSTLHLTVSAFVPSVHIFIRSVSKNEEVSLYMLSHKNTKNANFLFIVDMLRTLLARELITEKEYVRAKKYYMKLTGADIILAR